MTKNLISVIIPTYNRSDLICRAIDSVLMQTFKEIEIIVVDDGSTDNTLDLLSRYDKSQLVVITQKNKGPSAARNRGANEAKGEFLSFLDSDDVWLPAKLEKQITLLKVVGEHIPCCLCNAFINDETRSDNTLSFNLAPLEVSYSQGLWINVTNVLATRGVVFTQAVLVRKEAFLKVGKFNEELKIMEDWDLSLRLSLLGSWAYIKEPLLTYYSKRPGSLSQSTINDPVKLQDSIVRICSTMLDSPLKISKYAEKELKRKMRKAIIQKKLYSSSYQNCIIFKCILLLDSLRLIVSRRLYKIIPSLLSKVDDKPIEIL